MLPLLTMASCVVLAGGVLIPWIPCLELVNLDSPKSWIVPLGPRGEFSIRYDHSIYGAPAIEHFLIQEGGIVLVAVQTSHAGVAEYYGFEGSGPFYPMRRRLEEIILRVRMGQGQQRIDAGGRTVEVRRFGAPGDRVQIKANTCSLLGSILHSLGTRAAWP